MPHLPNKEIFIHKNHRDPGPCFCVFQTRPLQLFFVQCTEVCSKKLQSVQNAAAQLITCSRKYDHITPILKELHWLPVCEHIKFKIMLVTFKALHQQSLVYIQDLVMYYQPSRILRSSHLLLLNPTNFHQKSYGSRAFAVSAPGLWNSLRVFIRSCDNLRSFKSKLKTHLSRRTYYS